MGPFEKVLLIAQAQAADLARGDLKAATARLQEREALVYTLPSPDAADAEVVREILRLDRVLSGAIRERMVAIRNQMLDGHRGRQALAGYGRTPPPRSLRYNAVA